MTSNEVTPVEPWNLCNRLMGESLMVIVSLQLSQSVSFVIAEQMHIDSIGGMMVLLRSSMEGYSLWTHNRS